MIDVNSNIEKQNSIVPLEINEFVDKVEVAMLDMAKTEGFEIKERVPKHTFTPGLYAREFEMFPGDRITSRIHLTEHQFIISKGCIIVIENGEASMLVAPYHAITKAGTRRALWVPEWAVESCVWTTFHANPDNENVEQIENRILEPHINYLASETERKLIK